MSGAIACGTGPSAGAGSGGNFAVRGGGPINFCARLRRERRDDTESSDSSASVCGVCGGGVVYVFWGCSGGGLGGRGVDRGGDCIGWRGRLFGADARDGDAAGSTAGYSGRSRVENLFCTFFAVAGLVSLWLPILFFVRGALTDFLRGVAGRAGRSGFGTASMQETWWGRALVASRGSRAAYAILK